MAKPKMGLGPRLALAMVSSLLVLLAVLGAVYVQYLRQSQEQLVMLSEDRMGDLILRATRLAMLRNDRAELSQQLPEIGRQPQLQRLRIYDKSGVIRYSSLPSEVGHRVDMSADACDRCHASAQPLTRLDRPDRTRIYRIDGERVMGMIHPIHNEAACSAAPCHTHPPEQAVLGVLDVQMSLASVDATVARQTQSFMLMSLLVLAVVSTLSVLWVWRSVHRPVKRLLSATRAVSAGHFDQRISGRYHSELEELVRSFNQMTDDLQSARRESEGWARTLEKRVEEKSQALRRAQDDMIQVEKMASLGKLAAIVAHEINNPLAGIRTYAKLLLKRIVRGKDDGRAGFDAAETSEWLSRIESEAGRCGEIVRNLLSFARSTTPKVEPADMNELVRQTLRLVQHQLNLSGVEGRLDLHPDLPRIEGDPQQLKQAMLAMFINACEAMPHGGEMTVETRPVPGGLGHPRDVSGRPGDDGAIEVRIRDSGVGMDAETRKHIFEPFFSTKENGSSSVGTGLGLAVVYGIVQSHGGTIGVESTPGGGSTFTLRLPRVHPPRPEGEADA